MVHNKIYEIKVIIINKSVKSLKPYKWGNEDVYRILYRSNYDDSLPVPTA